MVSGRVGLADTPKCLTPTRLHSVAPERSVEDKGWGGGGGAGIVCDQWLAPPKLCILGVFRRHWLHYMERLFSVTLWKMFGIFPKYLNGY